MVPSALAAIGLALAGCSESIDVLSVLPAALPGSGYITVIIEVPDDVEFDVADVHLGPHHLINAELNGNTLTGLFQGAEAGEITLSSGGQTWPTDAVVEEPADPRLARIVTIGASLGMGVQGGTPSRQGALMSPSAQLARATGGMHTLPLLIPGLLPQMGASDLRPPPSCAAPGTGGFVSDAALDVVATATDPDSGQFDYAFTREDPDLLPMNLAVGDFRVGTVLNGPDRFSQSFLAHLVYDAEGGIGAPISDVPLDFLDQLDPTTILLFDVYGNDVITPIASSWRLDPDEMTPLEEAQPDLIELIERLATTDAEVFIATLPRPSLIAVTASQRQTAIGNRIQAGDTREEAEAWADGRLAAIDARGAALDTTVHEQAERFTNVYAVPVNATLVRIESEGLVVGDEVLTPRAFGGLLSTDGIHFSDTGYALVANETLAAMEDAWGVTLPRVDLQAVRAQDPWSAEQLASDGLDIEQCAAYEPTR